MKKVFILLLILIPIGCTQYNIKDGIEDGIEEVKHNNYIKALKHFSKAEQSEEYRAAYYYETAKIFDLLDQHEISIDFYKKAILEAKESNKFEIIKKNSIEGIKKTIDKKIKTIEEGKSPIHIHMDGFYIGYQIVSDKECSQKKCFDERLKCEKNLYGNMFTNYSQRCFYDLRIYMFVDEYGYLIDKKGEFIKFQRTKRHAEKRKQIFWIKMSDIKQINKISRDSTDYSYNADFFSINDKITEYKNIINDYPNTEYEKLCLKRVENLLYKIAVNKNTIEAYRKFLNFYPSGNFSDEAKLKIEELFFKNALSQKTMDGFKKYLLKYPKGKFIDKVNEQIEKLIYLKASEIDSIEQYNEYLLKYPNGIFKEKAQKKIFEITEDLSFKKAANENTINSFSSYIDSYPNGKYYVDAIWNVFRIKNKLDLYKKFIATYPESKYTLEAKHIIKKIAFYNCTSIYCYEQYIKDNPKTPYTKKAHKKVITLTKKNILSYNKYLKKYPATPYRIEVINDLYELYKMKNTIN